MNTQTGAQTTRRFPIRFSPGPAEGPGLFQLREIEKNRLTLPQYRDLGGGYGEHCIRRRGETSEPDVIAAVRAIEANRRDHPKCWITARSRVCPLCVADGDLSHSVGWEIRLADACAVHGCWLIDTCTCGAPLSRQRQMIVACDYCGRSLRFAKTSAAPAALVEMSRLLCHLVAGGRFEESNAQLPEEVTIRLAGMRFHELHLLYRMIGVAGDPVYPPGMLRSLFMLDPLEHSWTASTLAAEVIYRWPTAFHDLLDWNRRHNDDGYPFCLQRTLGHLYHDLFQHLCGDVFDFVRQDLKTYLALHWRGSTARSSRIDQLPFLKRRWVSASDAARSLALSHAALLDHIQRGDLIADCRVTKAGRSRIVIDRLSIDAFITARLANTCTLDQAARALGLKRSRLRRVVRPLLPSAWFASDQQWHIKIDEVEALSDLTESLGLIDELQGDEITLDTAMRYHRLSDAALIALVDAGQKGTGRSPVGRSGDGQGLSTWVFKRSTIAAVQGAHAVPAAHVGLPLPQLAEHLRVKQEVVYFLCRAGAINPIPSPSPGYRGAIVSWTEIERFQKEFIAARDLAIEVRSSPRALIVALGRHGLEPMYGSNSGCRQTFYRRDIHLAALVDNLLNRGPASRCRIPQGELDNTTQWRPDEHQECKSQVDHRCGRQFIEQRGPCIEGARSRHGSREALGNRRGRVVHAGST